jgi:hypothetical protein
MSFDELTAYFERLEAAAGRLGMYRLLGELFYKANPDEAAETMTLETFLRRFWRFISQPPA